MKKINKDIFITKAKKIHGDKYDYSKVEYINSRTKVCIICPIHGEFWQRPSFHLLGSGCPKCVGKKLSKKEIIQRFKVIHGDKYNYSKFEYINNKTKSCIICPEHGEFFMTPDNHLHKHGCPKCKSEKTSKNFLSNSEEFIKKAREIHGDKYDYSKAEYINSRTKVCIICPIHGEFWQTPNSHLAGNGCLKCSGKFKPTKENFIEKAKQVHGDKYDYSKVEYIDSKTKVCIICPEHGEFWQTPDGHINQKQGCPICKESRLEKELSFLLKENNINFIRQYRSKWLGSQSLDFYLPDYNIAIECQGIQHYEPISFFGGKKAFEKQLFNDKLKKEKCFKNNVKLLLYSNVNNSKTNFLNEIKNDN